MSRPLTVTYDVFSTPEAVALAAAHRFLQDAQAAVASRGTARIAVSGGSTPKAMFALLASPGEPFLAAMPWNKLQLFWVDERAVPPSDPESNFRMTTEQMLSKVPLPEANVFRMEGELPPEEAASRYESVLRNTLRLEGAEVPAFDLVLLGMGPDGHTASLFPHTEAIHELGRLTVANHVPQKDTWRITLTSPVINQGRDVVFLIEGEAKSKVLGEVFTGPRDPERLPSQLIRPASGQLLLLLDKAAAAELPSADQSIPTPDGPSQRGTLEL